MKKLTYLLAAAAVFAAGFVEKINQEGAGMWIKSLQLEKDETAMKGTMEVVYCHDQ